MKKILATGATLLLAGNIFVPTISAQTLSSSQNEIFFSANNTQSMVKKFIIEAPSTVVVNTPFSVTVRAADNANMTVKNYNGRIAFSTNWIADTVPNPGQAIIFYNSDAGEKTFTNGITFKKIGKQKIYVADIDNDIMSEIEINVVDSAHILQNPVVQNPIVKNTITPTQNNNLNAWNLIHCSIMKQGFTWKAPIDLFVNQRICGNTHNLLNFSQNTNSQLEYQRNLVKEFIARQTQKNQITSQKNLWLGEYETLSKSVAPYFAELEKYTNKVSQETSSAEEFIKYIRKNPTIWTQIVKNIDENYKKVQNLPLYFKQEIVANVSEFIGKASGETLMELENFAHQNNIQFVKDYLEKFQNKHNGKIADLHFNVVNNTFLFNKEDTKTSKTLSENFVLLDKNYETLNAMDYDFSVRGISFADFSVSQDNNLNQKGVSLNFDSQKIQNIDKFEIIAKHKTTGKEFTKSMSIKVVEPVSLARVIIDPKKDETFNFTTEIGEYKWGIVLNNNENKHLLTLQVIPKNGGSLHIMSNQKNADNMLEFSNLYINQQRSLQNISSAYLYLKYFHNQ